MRKKWKEKRVFSHEKEQIGNERERNGKKWKESKVDFFNLLIIFIFAENIKIMNNSISPEDRALVQQIISKTGKKFGIFCSFYSDDCLLKYKSNFSIFFQKILFDFDLQESTFTKRGLQYWFNNQIKRIEQNKHEYTPLPSFQNREITEDESTIFNLTDPSSALQPKRLLTKPKI